MSRGGKGQFSMRFAFSAAPINCNLRLRVCGRGGACSSRISGQMKPLWRGGKRAMTVARKPSSKCHRHDAKPYTRNDILARENGRSKPLPYHHLKISAYPNPTQKHSFISPSGRSHTAGISFADSGTSHSPKANITVQLPQAVAPCGVPLKKYGCCKCIFKHLQQPHFIFFTQSLRF